MRLILEQLEDRLLLAQRHRVYHGSVQVQTKHIASFREASDLALGTGHFRTPIARGQELMRELRGRISGLCQPTYVLDIPGGHGKVPLTPAYLTPGDDGDHGGTEEAYRVEDYQGGVHAYPPATDPRDGVASTEPE